MNNNNALNATSVESGNLLCNPITQRQRVPTGPQPPTSSSTASRPPCTVSSSSQSSLSPQPPTSNVQRPLFSACFSALPAPKDKPYDLPQPARCAHPLSSQIAAGKTRSCLWTHTFLNVASMLACEIPPDRFNTRTTAEMGWWESMPRISMGCREGRSAVAVALPSLPPAIPGICQSTSTAITRLCRSEATSAVALNLLKIKIGVPLPCPVSSLCTSQWLGGARSLSSPPLVFIEKLNLAGFSVQNLGE